MIQFIDGETEALPWALCQDLRASRFGIEIWPLLSICLYSSMMSTARSFPRGKTSTDVHFTDVAPFPAGFHLSLLLH